MVEVLNKITALIETYESGTWVTEDNLRIMHRELTSNIFFLTKYNIEAFKEHNTIQHNHNGSVSSGLILANEKVPQLRMLRKIESTANNVVNAMRSEITSLRNNK